MTASTESRTPRMLADFLGFTLAGAQPGAGEATGECACVRYRWQGNGLLELAPSLASGAARPADVSTSVLLSAGVHGDETAPIELLSRLVADLAAGVLPLACRLLVVLGNVDAMREGCRYIDDDLNRLFCGRHAQLPASHEAPRAMALEAAAARFFGEGAVSAAPLAQARWHIDMHTAIRTSVFEQFALLPHTDGRPSREMYEWLARARIAAVLLHTAKGNTYTQYTGETCGAMACTLELGKVQPFGRNDLTRFAPADEAVRALIAGMPLGGESPKSPMPRAFTVVDQITKRSDAFELKLAADVPNFTPLPKGTLLAVDGDYRYIVSRDEEHIVFPNPTVKPGLRAGLIVVETTSETLDALKSDNA